MPVTYTQCEGDVLNRVLKVMQNNHSDLADAKVVVDCIFASNEDGQAVQLHGYPCLAVVRKVSYKNRVKGQGDAEIVIDKLWWEDARPRQQDALIDHELTHLELVYDKYGKLKRDRAGRPKLTMRLHDWQLGGFEETAKVYGKDAPEVVLARDFKDRYGQFVFNFAKSPPKGEADEEAA